MRDDFARLLFRVGDFDLFHLGNISLLGIKANLAPLFIPGVSYGSWEDFDWNFGKYCLFWCSEMHIDS
jgi:hypothetical protein